MQKKNNFISKILNVLFPKNVKCIFCGEELNNKSYNKTCEKCFSSLPFIQNSCLRCGAPMNENQSGVCLKCKRTNYDFTFARSVFVYKNEIVKVVHKIKYGGKKYLFDAVSKYMAESFATWSVLPNIITCVPMVVKKQKARGYNQSKVLAENLADTVNLPFYELTRKIKDTTSQTSLSTSERMKNVKDSFAFNKEYKDLIKDKIICIIDDVITTGATTSEISRVLLENGAKACHVFTFAHTQLAQINFED